MSEQHDKNDPARPPGGYRLTASFPYLVRRVGLRIGELFDQTIAAYGVDVSMYRVMAALAEHDGQQLGQLAQITTIELSTLSRLVGAMATKGLLSRRRPRGNGRIVEISLSAKGRRLAEELMPIAERFEEIAVSGLANAEVVRLKSQLEAAYRNLDRIEAELAAPSRTRAPSPAKAQPAKARPTKRRTPSSEAAP